MNGTVLSQAARGRRWRRQQSRLKARVKSPGEGRWTCVCVCVHAQILMHGQKQASLISTLSEGQGVQELDSKSMTQSKMSARARSTRPEQCAKCGAAQKIWSDTRRRNLEGGQKEENGPRSQQIEQTDPSHVTQTPFNPPPPHYFKKQNQRRL